MKNALTVLLMIFFAGMITAQAPATKSVLGTVSAAAPDATQITVKPDKSAPIMVKVLPNTSVERIPPGETSLKNATIIKAGDLSVGDRVLVTLAPNGADALRVIVMSASDIAKHDEADRQDWNKRGVSGIVSAKNGDQITLKMKGPQGEVTQVVTTSDQTRFKKYAPDSVKFADARPSALAEVNAGDQLRARGNKDADGKVAAEDVVFGTFLTTAGSVVAVDPATNSITVKELGSSKSIIVKVTPDSTIKQMAAATAAPASAPAGGRAPAPGFAGAPNIGQMVDGMPVAKFADIKPGTSVVISSTKGSQSDQMTAILLITNADALIRMATTPNGRGGVVTFGSGGGGGLDVLGLP